MSDTIKIRLYINTGFAGCKHEDVHEISREEWERYDEAGRGELLDDLAQDFLANHVDYGAYVLEEDDEE